MDDKKPELLFSNHTPDKTLILSKRKSSPSNESFCDVKDKNMFFQRTKLFDIDSNRESLMLLKNLDDVDIDRKSLGISEGYLGLGKESLDYGRESLGIFAMDALEEKLNESNSISPSMSSILNRGILCSNSYASPFLNNSTCNTLKTEDLTLLDSVYPEVFSPVKNEQISLNSLQNAMFNYQKIIGDKNIDCKKMRIRTQSLNSITERQKMLKGVIINDLKTKLHRSQSLKQRPVAAREEDGDKFNDSIFMEARVLASKIGDNSIFEENGEVCKLDCMLQPDLVNEYNEPDNVQDVESVDKNEKATEAQADDNKILIKSSSDTDRNGSQINCDKIDLSNIVSPNTSKRNETVQNLSKIFQNRSLSTSRVSCSSSKSSKDAKEILENLSEILSSENPTSEQKSEGQNLLYSLADILYNSRSLSKKESSDDSGHSSIENDQDANGDSPKVLNAHCKPTPSESNGKPLDLSMNQQRKRLNKSVNCPTSGEKPENIPQVLKNHQVNIPKNLKTFNKLKTKKGEDKKRGPLKAILPLGNMAKVFSKQNRVNYTPPRNDKSTLGNKRTSTPRLDSKLCPVAQSTPDDLLTKQKRTEVSPSHLPKPKFNCPVSPLARPNKSKELSTSIRTVQRTLTDSALSKLKNSPSTNTINRRKSSDDIKLQPSSSGLKRSNSISKDARPTAANSNKSSSLLEKNSTKNVGIKSLNLVSKFRKSAGKENLPQ